MLELNSGEPSTSVLIAWDDGRQDWIDVEDIRQLRIWFISDEPMSELKAGPLQVQLPRFMEAEPAPPRSCALDDSLGIGIFSAVLEDVEADDRLLKGVRLSSAAATEAVPPAECPSPPAAPSEPPPHA